jgi:hypothetical protein
VASIDPAPLLTKEYAAVNKAATPNVVIHVPKYCRIITINVHVL